MIHILHRIIYTGSYKIVYKIIHMIHTGFAIRHCIHTSVEGLRETKASQSNRVVG